MNLIASLITPIILISIGYGAFLVLHKLNLSFNSNSDNLHLIVSLATGIISISGMVIGLNANWINLNLSFVYYLLIIIGSFFAILISVTIIKWLLNNEFTFKQQFDQKSMLLLVIVLTGSAILFHLLLSPLRGFDALWRYFAESLVFYQTDQIPLVNYLNYRPITYEPVNTLLYTFSFYLVTEPAIEFIPVIFLLMFLLLAYNFAQLVFKDNFKSLYTVSLLLFLPIVHWLLEMWMFYQELYVAYFFSLTIYSQIKFFSSKSNSSYLILFILGLSLAILSKLNGWILLPIILLLIPLGTKGRIIKIIGILLLWIFLSILGAGITFFWLFIPLFFYTILIIISIWKAEKTNKIASRYQLSLFFGGLGAGLALGGYWLYKIISRLPVGREETINRYFFLENAIFKFPLIKSGSNLIIEHMHAVDLFMVLFVIFLSQAFAVPWLIPKIIGIKQLIHHNYLIIWLTIPTMVWLAEFGQVNSVRYLFMLSIPISIITSAGIFHLWEIIRKYKQNLPEKPSWIFLGGFLLIGGLYFYPIIPLIFIIKFPFDPVQITLALEESYRISSQAIPQILIAIILTGLIILFPYKLYHSKFISRLRLIKLQKGLKLILLVSTIFLTTIAYTAPFSLVLITSAQGNLTEARASYDPYSTPEYQELILYLINENVVNTTILSANIPGIGFYTNIPTLDLREDPKPFEVIFVEENITKGLQLLRDPLYSVRERFGLPDSQQAPSVGYVVVPNTKFFSYNYFKTELEATTYLFKLIKNPILFEVGLENDQFIVYKAQIPLPINYYGLFDVYFTSDDLSTSIIYNDFKKIEGTNANLEIIIDTSLSIVQVQSMEIQLEITAQNMTYFDNSSFIVFNQEGFSKLSIPIFTLPTTFDLHSIQIIYPEVSYDGILEIRSIHFSVPIVFSTNQGITSILRMEDIEISFE